MKTYLQILKEEIIGTVKFWGEKFEVYVNPTKDEFDGINDHDYLYIIDSDKKDIYVSSIGLIHAEIVTAAKREGFLNDFNYTRYWKFGDKIDRFLTFSHSLEDGMYTNTPTDIVLNDKELDKELLKDNLRILISKDFSWLKKFKWFNYNLFLNMLETIKKEMKL